MSRRCNIPSYIGNDPISVKRTPYEANLVGHFTIIDTGLIDVDIGNYIAIKIIYDENHNYNIRFMRGDGVLESNDILPFFSLDKRSRIFVFQITKVDFRGIQLIITEDYSSSYKASDSDHWLTGLNYEWASHGELVLTLDANPNIIPVRSDVIDWTASLWPEKFGLLYTKSSVGVGEISLLDDKLSTIGTIHTPSEIVDTPTWISIDLPSQFLSISSLSFKNIEGEIYHIEFDTGFYYDNYYTGFINDNWFIPNEYGGWNQYESELSLDFSNVSQYIKTKSLWTDRVLFGIELTLTAIGDSYPGVGTLNIYDKSDSLLQTRSVTWDSDEQLVTLDCFDTTTLGYVEVLDLDLEISNISVNSELVTTLTGEPVFDESGEEVTSDYRCKELVFDTNNIQVTTISGDPVTAED